MVLTKNLENTGMETGNLFVNLFPVFVIFNVVALPLLVLWIGANFSPCFRDTFKAKFEAKKKAEIWNGVINKLKLSWLVMSIALTA